MKRLFLPLLVLCVCFAQTPVPRGRGGPPDSEEDLRFPNGKSQRDEIIKADHQKSVQDAIDLAKIAEDLKSDLERSDKNIVSVKNIKQTEEIEKLARSIRARLKRY
jgi:hypothetical protein